MLTISSALLLISGACLAVGFIYLRFWWAERRRLDYCAFALCTLSVALFSWGELGMAHSQTPEEYLFYAWWSFFPGTAAVLSVAWFAYVHLSGRRWLFWTYCISRLSQVVLHVFMTNGINFRQVTAVGRTDILGETLSYPVAVPNPWMALAQFSHLLLIIFCLDASLRTWRRGERRKALIFGSGAALFGTTVLAVSLGVLWGLIPFPVLISFSVFFIVAAMLYELNYDLHRAAMFAEKLRKSEAELSETLQQLSLSASAANVGMWTRKMGSKEFWGSDKLRELFGFSDSHPLYMEEFFRKIHPDDFERVRASMMENESKASDFIVEYRILPDSGELRWVEARGKVESINGKTKVIRGTVVDVTKRKMAEEAVHDLSRRLMNAQEKERARLARELHDDLSQSLALLSIQLAELRGKIPGETEAACIQIDLLVSEIERLSADVHRISHELHPAKLNQLGLTSALRGFCKGIAAAHSLKVEFESEGLPRSLPGEISLCLYRVAQESLQNVIKHSGASLAKVSIKMENEEIRLVITDNGHGFNPEVAKTKESLGLISIEERARAVDGTVRIVSLLGKGTRIEVLVPLKSETV
jgi:PAS domain S-box-containing protein